MITNEEFLRLCTRKVMKFEESRTDIDVKVDREDVFAVWTCKTLQNSKALFSAKHKGAYYYEFTMNGDKEEIYMDVYTKVINKPFDLQGKEIITRTRKGE